MRPYLLCLTFVCAATVAEAQIPNSLQKALAGGPERYKGTRTVTFDRANRLRSHVEFVTHLGKKSRVDFPVRTLLAGQVIVEDSHRRMQYLPRRNEIEVSSPRNELATGRLRRFVDRCVMGRWQLGSTLGGMIAGLNTDLIWFRDPKGVIRQRLWIDPTNGMILQRKLYDADGGELAGFVYTAVDYKAKISPNVFHLELPGVKVITPEMRAQRLAAKNGFVNLPMLDLPNFHLESAQMVNLAGTPALSEVFSGPKGRISLFRLHCRIDDKRLQSLAKGRVRAKTWVRNGETFALVGDIDEKTLEQVAKRLGG